MVTTRRSSQRQASTDGSQESGPSTSSQRVRSTSRRGRGGGAAAKRGRAQSLEPIEEDTAHHAPGQAEAVGTEGAPGPAPEAAGRHEEPLAVDAASAGDVERHDATSAATTSADAARGRSPAANPADESLPGEQRAASQAAEQRDEEPGRELHASEPAESSSTTSSSSGGVGNAGRGDSSDDSDDDDILGPNLMGQLASSLRAALQARAGTREASPSPPPDEPQPGPSEPKLGLTSDPNSIRWQPEMRPPQELVKAPQRVAPGTGADKEKGLAKQLLAPPRTKSADQGPGGSREDAKRWFQLPSTKITDDVKRELRLLRLRGAYDPKRFYKSFDETKFPKHFQIGTVVDSPQDFYSSRLTARERGSSITEELLADPAVAAVRKRRYTKLQGEATRHQKVKKRKTENPRNKAKPKRPKH